MHLQLVMLEYQIPGRRRFCTPSWAPERFRRSPTPVPVVAIHPAPVLTNPRTMLVAFQLRFPEVALRQTRWKGGRGTDVRATWRSRTQSRNSLSTRNRTASSAWWCSLTTSKPEDWWVFQSPFERSREKSCQLLMQYTGRMDLDVNDKRTS